MKTIEQIKSELQELRIEVIDVIVWHSEGLSNDIQLIIDGCLSINNLFNIAGYFGGIPYVHNGDGEKLQVTIADINNQTEGL